MNKEVNLLGYKITDEKLDLVSSLEKLVINTINPHSYCVADKDDVFRSALKSSDILLPDGIGIVLAIRFLKGKRISKIAGADLHEFCLKKANTEGKKVFYLGASQATLDKITERLRNDHPNIKVLSYSPPYKAIFTNDDNKTMIEKVNNFEPDFLFIGMTAPKQEKWVFEHKNELNASVICSIGAVFDFYAGTVKRPHRFWIKIGLEWLVRFIKEPKRLAERNLISMPKFIWVILKAKITGKH